ncbi:TVP38/TMEM64 family protein [Halorientalis pallida]|uniref:TVP38/TMEM64 family protein n=1 Tax=Halorientalis pallida TaxID=2479928 RepID=A0A498KTE9_9EURY|nr:VTT domain-containing protein [Halorientalis pallida]RXK47988.1 TVP38/TMEM64 family protein [Halorientalis pallida]
MAAEDTANGTAPAEAGEPADDESGSVFVSAAARRGTLVRSGALGFALAAVTLLVTAVFPQVTDPAWLRATLRSYGPFTPVVFATVQAVQVVVAPVPGQILAGVAGYLFGTLPGTLYTIVGVVIGSAVVFGASRLYGRPYVERVLTEDTLDRWDRFLDRTGVPGLFVLFLLPTFPDDILCFVAGLSEIDPPTFLALVLFGRGPSFLVIAYAGTQLSDGRLLRTGAVLLGLTILTGAVLFGTDRLIEALETTT